MGWVRTSLVLTALAVGVAISASGTACVGDSDPCPDYCTTVATVCGGKTETKQYIDDATCRAMCATIRQNAAGAKDTIACRVAAKSNVGEVDASDVKLLASACGDMGPYSPLCAGSACTAWCRIALTTCTDMNQQYKTQAECETACNGFNGGMTDFVNVTTTTQGNTLTCRLYHLEAASVGPDLHCPHLAPPPKVTPCK